MKKILLIFLLLLPFTLYAEVDLAIGQYQFNYREFNNFGQTLNQEVGDLYGFKLAYLNNSETTYQLFMRAYQGDVDYIGSTQSGTPHNTITAEELYQLGALFYFPVEHSDDLHLVLGFTTWYWDRDIQTVNGVQGLHEVYRWNELNIGLKYHRLWFKKSRINLSFQFLQISNASMVIDLPNSEETLHLGNKPGLRFEISNDWLLSASENISLAFVTEYWSFGKSKAVFTDDFYGQSAFISEPESETRHTLIELSYRHDF